MDNPQTLDCLIIGGGPAGLAAALYLARFNRRFLLIDGGAPRAAYIPTSHNIPFFTRGIGGPDILARERESAKKYGARFASGTVAGLQKRRDEFVAEVKGADGRCSEIRARYVILATGAVDIEPDLPDVPNAVQCGLVRYCPICDGYEARGKKVAVIGHGERGLGEAVFMARTYTRDVTLLTLGRAMDLDGAERERIAAHGIRVVTEPVTKIECRDDRITAIRTRDGSEHRFDVLYSALGMKVRSELALALEADHDETGSIVVGDHSETSVKGLYAAGDVIAGLRQIVVGISHAARAAVDIHNHFDVSRDKA